ncbi:MAG TPA: PAS domain-containing protein, partial [Candidatus Acidoferrales bacterium]|nr:PAS domain-containing protein [Candidatus Acidoferrales bacterium]
MTARRQASNLSPPHFTLDPSLAVKHRLLSHLLAYWRCKAGARAMPARADIDPLDLREHMGWMILTDVASSPLRFRFRLIGAEVTRLVGRDSTGKFWDEIYAPAIYDATTAAMRWVVEHRRPLRVL